MQILPEGINRERIKKLDPGEEIIKEIAEAKDSGAILEGRVVGISRNSHGRVARVDYRGMEFIIPAEEIDTKKVNLERYLGRRVFFKVLEVDTEAKKAVLSRKSAVEERSSASWETVEVGQMRIGKVVKLDKNHAILDIGGITAILRREDFSYARIRDLKKELELGDIIDVKVTELDREKQHVCVSVKEILADPWEIVKEEVQVDSVWYGKVTNCYTNSQTGRISVFVQLEPSGITVVTPPPRFGIPAGGTEVMVKIKAINTVKRRVYGVIIRRLKVI